MAYLNTDIPELSGSDTAICLDNLDLLGHRQGRITESILAELSELADAIIRDAGGDPDTVDSILLSLQGAADDMPSMTDGGQRRGQVAEINRSLVTRISAYTGLYMRLILYRMIEDRLPARPIADKPTPLPDTARGRIAYMAGSFADKAYLRLSACVPSARAATFHSFVEACEEVRGGLCEYGILPLENTQNGKLTAFSRLIIRYGLCIVAIAELENGAAPGQSTCFALVRKADDVPVRSDTLATVGALPHRLELLHLTDAPTVAELMGAATFCGLRLSRVDTLPRWEEADVLRDVAEDVPPICCVFTVGARADLVTFRRFLATEAPEDILMGLYGTL